MHRNLRRILVGTASAMMLGAVMTSPAQAGNLNISYVNVHPSLDPNRCMDSGWADPGYKNRGHVYSYACQSGNRHQQWKIVMRNEQNNPLMIQNVATRLCLTAEHPGNFHTNYFTFRTDMYTTTCGTGTNQRWLNSSGLLWAGQKVVCPKNAETGYTWESMAAQGADLKSVTCEKAFSDRKDSATWVSSTVS